MASHSAERVLGKRTVYYMRNEAMIGRITRHRIQTLASVLGVASIVKLDLDECQDGDARYRVMGDVLDAWVVKHNVGQNADDAVAKLASALDSARLTYHSKAVRSMNGKKAINKAICM